MPYNPPQPPPAPAPVQQQQQQQQGAEIPITLNDNNSSGASSSSENIVSQAGSLNNYQINNAYDQFFGYRSGTRIPVRHTVGADVLVNDNGDLTFRVGWNWNIGGKAEALAHADIERFQVRSDAEMCAKLAVSNIKINTSLAPEYQVCDAFEKRVVAAAPSAQLQDIHIQQQNLLIQMEQRNKQLEEKLYNLTIKLEQMKSQVNQEGGRG